ncbi:MAG: AAA family ATPase [Armatimonadetes bacterium]|nr:AAA family ATPase [Armatimonadota bacterium]
MIWQQRGADFRLADATSDVAELPCGIYQLVLNPQTGLYVTRVSDRFEMPSSVYGLETAFKNRVLKTYRESSLLSLGVCLTGARGTGKTFTAKLIAEELGLPVILVGAFFAEMPTFIASVPQDVCVFIDEFEKLYRSREEDEMAGLLSLLDGVYKSRHRRVYLLTSNDRFPNINLEDRPGRVRYVKTFAGLSREQIAEIARDLLRDQTQLDELVQVVSGASTSTIDTTIALIEEVNIHDAPVSELVKDFNVRERVTFYELRRRKCEADGTYGKSEFIGEFRGGLQEYGQHSVGYPFVHGGEHMGDIESVFSSDVVQVTVTNRYMPKELLESIGYTVQDDEDIFAEESPFTPEQRRYVYQIRRLDGYRRASLPPVWDAAGAS